MDNTLQQYLDCADKIHSEIVLNHHIHRTRHVKNSLYELESFIKQIQSVSCRIAQIYNSCKSVYNENAVVYRAPISLQPVDALLEKDNWVDLIRKSRNIGHNIRLAPNISVRAFTVDNIDGIPNSPLYWVKSLNQFAIRVNGVVFRGNIGNIYGKGECVSGVARCKHANACPQLLAGKKCKFYHDISELTKCKKIPAPTIEIYKSQYRNFAHRNPTHVGGRNTLKTDLDLCKLKGIDGVKWIDSYKSQMFHDFLVVMSIHQMGMLDEYPDVAMVSNDYSGSNTLVCK
jgi:hypothetical protein